jgi:hypothetical protein
MLKGVERTSASCSDNSEQGSGVRAGAAYQQGEGAKRVHHVIHIRGNKQTSWPPLKLNLAIGLRGSGGTSKPNL